ncbi:hypothetical protein CFIICLFH_3572 [Methylobacterium goesingense]|uniref:Anti-sigma factor NepR domain-containing protein n=1 Tax=Methylobacterium goesingense TaxID=243690 RepID=A0ABV2L500_9HYPH|nr:hypothetical protein CFIICLFH_3572 [Methylobacterium goesingense]
MARCETGGAGAPRHGSDLGHHMSDGETEKSMPFVEINRVYASPANASEKNLGRTLRAMYDAVPSQPPSRRLGELLHRLHKAFVGTSR